MSRYIPNPTPCHNSRRSFLWEVGGGFASLALVDLLSREGVFAADAKTHHKPKAKHCIFLFMNGAPSQVDTFDPKPELAKYHGQPYHGKVKVGSNGRPIGYLMQSPFKFDKHGQSGLEISDLFPHTAKYADDLCVLRAMYTDSAAHSSGCLQLNTGSPLTGKPSLGTWLSYGLGSLNDNLPSFVVMTDPRGGPIGGAPNWGAGYMPAAYQGTLFRGSGNPLLDLATPGGVSERTQRHGLDLLGELNEKHAASFGGRSTASSYQDPQLSELKARIESYELAYRMQSSAAEAVDLAKEDRRTQDMYGLHEQQTADFGHKCLIARRLVERGVRFVQLYSGGGHIEATWDGHNDCITNHKTHAGETDRPIAALIAELKTRGLWEETLLVWGGEVGSSRVDLQACKLEYSIVSPK